MNEILIYKFLILILGTLFVFSFLLYIRERRRQNILKKNSDWATDKAREKAQVLIDEAKKSALRELDDVKLETDKYEQELEAGVKRLTEQEIREYKETVGKITHEVEDGVRKEASRLMLEKIKADYEEERKKIENYTGVKMREIEEKIAGITDEAVLIVLGKQMDNQINKRLIIEALEEIKQKYAI